MNRRPTHKFLLTLAASLALALAPGAAQAQPVPFACTGEAFIVQNQAAQLFEIDQTQTPFDLVPVGIDTNDNSDCDAGEQCNLEFPAGSPIEINAMGFRRSNGLLYAVRVNLTANTNQGIIQIDSNGDVVSLGNPGGTWPTNIAMNGGDVSPDGNTMYVTRSTGAQQTLHVIDLVTFTSAAVAVLPGANTGAANVVLDYAVHPTASPPLLFGADRQGQLVRLDPTSGVRTDFAVSGGLPGGGTTDYGGAWFNASGNLFVYDNSGQIFEIDIGDPTSPTPMLLPDSQTGDSSSRNDSAACLQDVVGVAKQMSSTSTGVPATVTIDYVFENFGPNTVDNLTAVEDLEEVFGTAGVDFQNVMISSSPDANFANSNFDGSSDKELIGTGETLTSAGVQTIQVTFTLNTINAAKPDPAGPPNPDRFDNSVTFFGDDTVTNQTFGDVSTSEEDAGMNLNPDPDGDGIPDERRPATITVDQVPVELMGFEIH